MSDLPDPSRDKVYIHHSSQISVLTEKTQVYKKFKLIELPKMLDMHGLRAFFIENKTIDAEISA